MKRETALVMATQKRTRVQYLVWGILPLATIGGWWYPVLGYFLPLCLMVGMSLAPARGRKWCDWLCPRGSALEVVFSRFRKKGRIPAVLKNPALRVGVLLALMAVVIIRIPKAWPDVHAMGSVFVLMLTVTTVVAVVLALFSHPRAWCAFCPGGTMANWVGRGRFPLMIQSKCTACKKCDKVCPIQVRRWEHRPVEGPAVAVPEPDCLKCGLCVAACPQGALRLGSP